MARALAEEQMRGLDEAFEKAEKEMDEKTKEAPCKARRVKKKKCPCCDGTGWLKEKRDEKGRRIYYVALVNGGKDKPEPYYDENADLERIDDDS